MHQLSPRRSRARRSVRRVIAAVALALIPATLLVACGSDDDAASGDLDRVTIQLQLPENGLFSGFWYGKAEGIYEKHGIDLVIEPGVSSQAASDAVARGTVDFTTSSFPSVALNRVAGNPLVGLAEVIRGGNQGLLVGSDSGIESWSDLEGKSVIITTGSSQKPLYDAAVTAAGVDPDKIEVVNVNQNVINQTFASGGADAVLTLFPFSEPLVAPQRDVEAISFSEAGVEMPGFFLISSEEYVSENADLTERFVQATLESWAGAYENQDDAIAAMLAENPALKEEDAGAVFEAFAANGCGVDDNGTWFGDFTAEELEGGVETLVSSGVLEEGAVDLATTFPRATLDALPAEGQYDCADLEGDS
ncbi:ABC transporter substrate-binding protein [Aeromicrobium alkaliterrae]|uniref:Thiamine pyrimidine synthase n=1 Tax=Aeromicrobium alkaliterrae TaxID=302168 RepID=A0ABN2K801_9ACTN